MDNDYLPTASWVTLRERARLLQQLRQFFADHEFLEVETPVLSADSVVDRYIDPLSATLFSDARRPDVGRRLWLQTSPEFHMKRLLASGGASSIYQVAKAFRGGESGPWHNPEFTMVEWYRCDDTMDAGMQLLSDLSRHLLNRGAAEITTYRDVFWDRASVDPMLASTEELMRATVAHGIAAPTSLSNSDRDEWLNLLFGLVVQPTLGILRPQIVFDYPASQAALACVRPSDPPVAERFELFVQGVELANGYRELLDADVLQQRSAFANRQREADGRYQLPEQSRLLTAMQHGLPTCAGVALGFDRLVMVATQATDIAEVMAFAIDRA